MLAVEPHMVAILNQECSLVQSFHVRLSEGKRNEWFLVVKRGANVPASGSEKWRKAYGKGKG